MINTRKALKELKSKIKHDKSVVTEDTIKIAITALEKQIYKKVEYEWFNEEDYIKCPTCGKSIATVAWINYIDEKIDFCENCGQALKWEK